MTQHLALFNNIKCQQKILRSPDVTPCSVLFINLQNVSQLTYTNWCQLQQLLFHCNRPQVTEMKLKRDMLDEQFSLWLVSQTIATEPEEKCSNNNKNARTARYRKKMINTFDFVSLLHPHLWRFSIRVPPGAPLHWAAIHPSSALQG